MARMTATAVSEPVELQPQDHNQDSGDARLEEAAPPPDANTTQAVQPLPVVGRVRLKLFSAAFCFLNAGINDGSLGALIPYIIRQYGISTSWMAIPYATTFAGWFLAALVGSYLRIRFGMGGSIIIGAFLQFVAQVFRFWIPPFGLFSFSFCMVSLGQGLQDPQANTFVSSLESAHRWLGLIHGCYGLGSLVGPLIAAAIASNFRGHWAAFYYVPTGVGIMNLVLCAYAFREETTLKRPANSGERRSRTALVEMKATLKQKPVWLLSLFFFFYLGAAITAGGWIVEFLVTVRNGRLSQVGYISSAFMGGLALGRFLLAEPTFRFGEKRMLLLYAVMALALQIVFWRVPNIVVNAVSVSFMGFVLGPFFATAVSVGSKIIPQELQQSGLGFIFVMAQVGGSVFPAITGIISAQAGVGTLQPMLVGLLAAMTVSWALVPNPKSMGMR